MTFALNPTNLSGATGGINQSTKPKLETDNSFDKILDLRIEKKIDQNRQNETQKNKVKGSFEVKSNQANMKKPLNEVSQNQESKPSNDEKNVSDIADERIAKLKKLASKIKESDSLKDKEIKELKDELDNLIESLLASDSELTPEQLEELSLFLNEISEVLEVVEVKLTNLLSETESVDKVSASQIATNETSNNSEVNDKLVETLENLKESVAKVLETVNDSLNDTSKEISKTEFSELLSEISKEMETLSESSQKILENNPELLKVTTQNADSNVEVEKTQISNEVKKESEHKSSTVLEGEEVKSSTQTKDENTDASSKLVESKSDVKEENIKIEESNSEKNVEILKFENTLIRSAKVNNPVKAQAFEKNIMNQVINHTTSNLNILENGSEMILKLYPKNLGEVAVKLAIDKGVVLAEFNVESQSVKEVLESNLADLRTALSNKGFLLQGLDVSVGDNGSGNNSRQGQQSSKNKNKFFDILEVEEELLNSNTSENSTTIDTLK